MALASTDAMFWMGYKSKTGKYSVHCPQSGLLHSFFIYPYSLPPWAWLPVLLLCLSSAVGECRSLSDSTRASPGLLVSLLPSFGRTLFGESPAIKTRKGWSHELQLRVELSEKDPQGIGLTVAGITWRALVTLLDRPRILGNIVVPHVFF